MSRGSDTITVITANNSFAKENNGLPKPHRFPKPTSGEVEDRARRGLPTKDRHKFHDSHGVKWDADAIGCQCNKRHEAVLSVLARGTVDGAFRHQNVLGRDVFTIVQQLTIQHLGALLDYRRIDHEENDDARHGQCLNQRHVRLLDDLFCLPFSSDPIFPIRFARLVRSSAPV